MAYSAQEKAIAIDIINQHGGMTQAAIADVATALNRRVSTSTLHGWVSKPKSETETKKRNEPERVAALPSVSPSMEALTDKQQIFVNEYLICWNATEAARRADYSEDSAYAIGWENLRKPQIRAAIAERLAEHTMSADEAMARLSAQARASMQDVVNPETGAVDLVKAVNNGTIHAVKKYKRITGDNPRVEVELYDVQSALLNIWKNQRVIAGMPTEVIAVLPQVQELCTLLAEAGMNASTVFERMIQQLHADNKPDTSPG